MLAIKKFLGVKVSTPNVMVYGESGRFPLQIDSKIKVIKYWLRILDMPFHRLPKKCYNMMLLYDKNGKNNWVTNVKELLFTTGFGNIWLDQSIDSQPNFIECFKQRLRDTYLQNWTDQLSLSSKCFYYRMF